MRKWSYQLSIPNQFVGKSVKEYLSEYLLLPKHLIYTVSRDNRVLVNERYLPLNFKLHSADQLSLKFVPEDFTNPFPNQIPDQTEKINVAFENKDLLIVNKKRGVKTHANQPNEIGATMNFAAAYLSPSKPYMVHRLDQQTSGALIIAKNPAVVPPLIKMLKDKTIKRTYLAWVHGTFNSRIGIIKQKIGKDPTDKRKRRIDPLNGLRAVTHYRVIKDDETNSLLEIHLETGRTHQIRVHLASINHPIINDPLYGSETVGGVMLLHSWKIQLKTPFYFQPLQVTAEIPKEFYHI